MTTLQRRSAAPVSGRKQVAAVVVILVAAGVLVGTGLARRGLLGYQIALNIVGALALVAAAVSLLRGARKNAGRRLAVTLTWLAACGIIAESGDHQARLDVTGALGATNTTYFLPGAVWVCLALLIFAAIAVTDLTKRMKGES